MTFHFDNVSVPMPAPGLAAAFSLETGLSPAREIGALATGGTRSVRLVERGTLSGGAAGVIVSGSENRLARTDGVTVLDLSCLIEMADGVVVRLIGTGYETGGRQRMTIAFEVAATASWGWLATRAFVAERPTPEAPLAIAQVI